MVRGKTSRAGIVSGVDGAWSAETARRRENSTGSSGGERSARRNQQRTADFVADGLNDSASSTLHPGGRLRIRLITVASPMMQ